MSDHEEIDVDRVRERVKHHLHRRPLWQFLLLIWVGLMVSSWLVSGMGYSMMRGRFAWGGSPVVVIFLIILVIGWLQRGVFSSRSSSRTEDDDLDAAIRRELRRERERMATGDWDDPQDAGVYEKPKRADAPDVREPANAGEERVVRLGDDGELMFDDTDDNDNQLSNQHHSAAS